MKDLETHDLVAEESSDEEIIIGNYEIFVG
jgi:hypothetical protein